MKGYSCPKCGSNNLRVLVTTSGRLVQTIVDDENETTVDVSQNSDDLHHFNDLSHMSCDTCWHYGTAKDFEWESGPKGTITVVAEQPHFKVGDIVSHSSGRICNGRYGQIILDWNQELMVLDNEGGPDISVKFHESELTVVGHISTHAHLLEEFVTCP